MENILVLCNQFDESFAKNRNYYFKKNFNPWFANKKCFKKIFMSEKVLGKKKSFICAKKGKWNIFEFYLINLI